MLRKEHIPHSQKQKHEDYTELLKFNLLSQKNLSNVISLSMLHFIKLGTILYLDMVTFPIAHERPLSLLS